MSVLLGDMNKRARELLCQSDIDTSQTESKASVNTAMQLNDKTVCHPQLQTKSPAFHSTSLSGEQSNNHIRHRPYKANN